MLRSRPAQVKRLSLRDIRRLAGPTALVGDLLRCCSDTSVRLSVVQEWQNLMRPRCRRSAEGLMKGHENQRCKHCGLRACACESLPSGQLCQCGNMTHEASVLRQSNPSPGPIPNTCRLDPPLDPLIHPLILDPPRSRPRCRRTWPSCATRSERSCSDGHPAHAASQL